MGRRWNLRDKLTRSIVMKKKKHSFGLDNTNIGNGWFVLTPLQVHDRIGATRCFLGEGRQVRSRE